MDSTLPAPPVCTPAHSDLQALPVPFQFPGPLSLLRQLASATRGQRLAASPQPPATQGRLRADSEPARRMPSATPLAHGPSEAAMAPSAAAAAAAAVDASGARLGRISRRPIAPMVATSTGRCRAAGFRPHSELNAALRVAATTQWQATSRSGRASAAAVGPTPLESWSQWALGGLWSLLPGRSFLKAFGPNRRRG